MKQKLPNSVNYALTAIITGQEKERLRLSKELHDGLGPMLTHLKLLIQNKELPVDKKNFLAVELFG